MIIYHYFRRKLARRMITGETAHRFAPGEGVLVILVQIFHVLECIKAISTASKTIADFGLPLNRTAISNS
jgi:hypothetical protein